MDGLNIILTAAVVDVPVSEYTQTKVKINFLKSSDKIDVADFGQGFRSAHRFLVKDATLFGYGYPHSLSREQAMNVLALSCSLTNPIILFAHVDPTYYTGSVIFGKIPSKVNIDETGEPCKVTITNTSRLECSLSILVERLIDLHEEEVLETANRLLIIKLFDRSNRSLKESNILASIQAYLQALKDTDISSCYTSLYIAFEKGVTADDPNLKNKAFDLAASAITKYSDKEIEDIRLFYNRIKHASRDKNDLTLLLAGEAHLKEWIKKLKLAADKTILFRIS